MFQLFNVFNARSDERSAFTELFRNQWLLATIGASLLLHVAVIFLAGGVLDRESEPERLAGLRGGGELGGVVERME